MRETYSQTMERLAEVLNCNKQTLCQLVFAGHGIIKLTFTSGSEDTFSLDFIGLTEAQNIVGDLTPVEEEEEEQPTREETEEEDDGNGGSSSSGGGGSSEEEEELPPEETPPPEVTPPGEDVGAEDGGEPGPPQFGPSGSDGNGGEEPQ